MDNKAPSPHDSSNESHESITVSKNKIIYEAWQKQVDSNFSVLDVFASLAFKIIITIIGIADMIHYLLLALNHNK